MTRRISPVAVCCSSDSVSARLRDFQLGEEPDVLDGDHGLVGEGLQQLRLPVGERPHLGAPDRDRPQGLGPRSRGTERIVRNPRFRANSALRGYASVSACRSATCIARRSRTTRPATVPCARGRITSGSIGPSWATRRSTSPSTRWIAASNASQRRAALAATAANTGWTSVGELRDHAQDLARRGLLLEGLGERAVPRLELLEQAHVLDGDHRLVGEGLDEGDFPSENGRTSLRMSPMTPIGSPSRSMGTPRKVRIANAARAAGNRIPV